MKIFALFLILLLPQLGFANPVALVEDLQQDAEQARLAGKPVVVIYTASYCHYCEAVKSEFFNHMARDNAYNDRIVLREVIIDSSRGMKGFDGKQQNYGGFASEQGVYLVPTVGFYDSNGRTVAESIVGVATLDYYGWYLDKRIETAERAVNKDEPKAVADNN